MCNIGQLCNLTLLASRDTLATDVFKFLLAHPPLMLETPDSNPTRSGSSNTWPS